MNSKYWYLGSQYSTPSSAIYLWDSLQQESFAIEHWAQLHGHHKCSSYCVQFIKMFVCALCIPNMIVCVHRNDALDNITSSWVNGRCCFQLCTRQNWSKNIKNIFPLCMLCGYIARDMAFRLPPHHWTFTSPCLDYLAKEDVFGVVDCRSHRRCFLPCVSFHTVEIHVNRPIYKQ